MLQNKFCINKELINKINIIMVRILVFVIRYRLCNKRNSLNIVQLELSEHPSSLCYKLEWYYKNFRSFIEIKGIL